VYLLYAVPPELSRCQLSSPCWRGQVALLQASASGTDLKKGACVDNKEANKLQGYRKFIHLPSDV